MSGTTSQGCTNDVRLSIGERAHLMRALAVVVVAQLALLAALAGCGLINRGGHAVPTTRLQNAYPTFAPGVPPKPAAVSGRPLLARA